MRLEPPVKQGDSLLLEVKNPPAGTIEALAVVIAPPGTRDFQMVPLDLRGDVWSTTAPIEASVGSPLKYFLAATLAGRAQVLVGSEAQPFGTEQRKSRARLSSYEVSGAMNDDAGNEGRGDGQTATLRRWFVWNAWFGRRRCVRAACRLRRWRVGSVCGFRVNARSRKGQSHDARDPSTVPRERHCQD